MNSTLRILNLATALFLGSMVTAQNVVTVTGTVIPCAGVIYPVHIVTNSVPPLDTTVYTGANCQYSFTFFPVPTQGVVTVSTTCDGGVTWISSTGAWNPFLGTVILNLACNSVAPCEACFSFNSPTPFVVDFSNCSVLPSGENGMLWEFPDGSTYEPPPPGLFNSPSYTFDSAGVYPFCFTILDYGPIDGCSYCDTLYVDEQGNVTSTPPSGADCLGVVNGPNLPGTPCSAPSGAAGIWSPNCVCIENAIVDCEGVTGGSALPGTPCQVPGTILQGIWSSDCECIANSNPDCQAGFWVFQAYEVDSLNPNGGAVPIPFELWVWNLSTGTSPFEFEWDFGDGTSSFDAYPTHVYGASGPYNLCLTLSDAASCTSTYCDSVSIDGDGFYEGMAPESEVRNGFTIHVLNQLPASVEEQAFNEPRLWPNPVTDALNLSFRSTVSGNVPVSIIDANGRTMRQERLAFARGTNSIRLDAADLSAGIYLLRIGNDGNTMSIRFIKH